MPAEVIVRPVRVGEMVQIATVEGDELLTWKDVDPDGTTGTVTGERVRDDAVKLGGKLSMAILLDMKASKLAVLCAIIEEHVTAASKLQLALEPQITKA